MSVAVAIAVAIAIAVTVTVSVTVAVAVAVTVDGVVLVAKYVVKLVSTSFRAAFGSVYASYHRSKVLCNKSG